MATKETREPTLAEIMKEIKKCKDETIKGIIEESRQAVVLMLVALGASIVFLGLSYIIERTVSTWGIWLTTIPIGAGLLLMIEAALMAKKGRRRL